MTRRKVPASARPYSGGAHYHPSKRHRGPVLFTFTGGKYLVKITDGFFVLVPTRLRRIGPAARRFMREAETMMFPAEVRTNRSVLLRDAERKMRRYVER